MIYVVTRHATTPWNEEKIVQGYSDLDYFNELNERGREEAVQVASLLASMKISRIVSSTLKRARQTAECIGIIIGAEITFDEGLRECSFGCLEGSARPQTIEKYGSSLAELWSNVNVYDFSPFGGENRNQVFNRHLEVLRENSNGCEEKILLVGHGRGLWTLLAGLGYPPQLKVGEIREIVFS